MTHWTVLRGLRWAVVGLDSTVVIGFGMVAIGVLRGFAPYSPAAWSTAAVMLVLLARDWHRARRTAKLDRAYDQALERHEDTSRLLNHTVELLRLSHEQLDRERTLRKVVAQ